MKRVIAYVDGFNLYHGLRAKGWKRFYWLNLPALVRRLLKPDQQPDGHQVFHHGCQRTRR